MPEVNNEAFDVLPPVETDVLAPDPAATKLRGEEGDKLKKAAMLTSEAI